MYFSCLNHFFQGVFRGICYTVLHTSIRIQYTKPSAILTLLDCAAGTMSPGARRNAAPSRAKPAECKLGSELRLHRAAASFEQGKKTIIGNQMTKVIEHSREEQRRHENLKVGFHFHWHSLKMFVMFRFFSALASEASTRKNEVDTNSNASTNS